MQISDILSILAVVVTIIGIARQWARDKSTVKIEEAAARKTDAEIAAMLDERAAQWIDKLEKRVSDQDCEIVKLKARIDELERRETEHQRRAQQLQRYIEYLLAGIRILIRQLTDDDQFPKFDPVGLEDFLLDNVG